jgi:hypothetical protein
MNNASLQAPAAHRHRPSALRRLPSALRLPALALAASLFASSALAEDTTAVAKTPEIDHMVYLSFLPDTDELMADAKANGLTVLRLDKLADRVVITYKYPDGHEATLGYKLLSSASSNDRVIGKVTTVSSPSTTTVVERTVIEREPEIIYVDRTPRTRVVYRERDDFWLPLTVGLGIGYITGHHSHHGHWRSHYSGHWRSYRGHHGYRGHGRR